MVISRTPYRISFFGGGTDYPSWYWEHGGAVLAVTIDKYCYLSCRFLPPFFGHRTRLVYSQVELCQSNDEIRHPSVREVLRYLQIDEGLEIHHDGDLPARSGMGSSSSFTVGLLHALYALKGRICTKQQLAMESIHIEQNLLEETVGSQDQVMAAYGGFQHVLFMPGGQIAVRPLTLAQERFKQLNAHLLLFYTGIVRTASQVAKSYAHNVTANERRLRAMKAMVDDALEILNSGRDLIEFGQLLDEAWQLKRGLSQRVSTGYIDQLYDEARKAGAVGGKLLGAGGGGFLLVFAPPERHAAIRQRLGKLIHVPFRFETGGSQIIFYDLDSSSRQHCTWPAVNVTTGRGRYVPQAA